MQLATLWIIAAAVFGAIVGSFLNVVIFRLPRGLSISQPKWSFCPHCEKPIHFSDNIPVVSWLALRGKCRSCSTPIGVVYPTIECLTAFLFLMVFDGLFVGKALPLVGEFSTDWPVLVAYLSLFASLLAISGMDLEAYMIDVRVSIFAMVVGVTAMAAWFALDGGASAAASGAATSAGRDASHTAQLMSGPALAKTPTGFLPFSICLVAIAAGLAWAGWALVWPRLAGRGSGSSPSKFEDDESEGFEDQIPEAPAYLKTAQQLFRPRPIFVFLGLIVAFGLWQAAFSSVGLPVTVAPVIQRGIAACFVLMVLLVLASIVHRESDEQIVEEIEAERSGARRVALQEFATLLPGLVAGLLVFLYFRTTERLDDGLNALVGGWLPGGATGHVIEGAVQSLAAMIWSAAIGWGVRIGGTLAFGKEAYGTGDIYIMAAIGAVMGIWGLVFCFFLAAPLALIGVVATLFWKSSRAVPFGPWLAMGAFAAIWLYRPLLGMFGPAGSLIWDLVTGRM